MSLKTVTPGRIPQQPQQVFPLDRNLQPLQANTWVHLQSLPSPYSFGEALLLCPQDADHWVVWIPDHGEAVLSQKYLLVA